MTRKKNPISNFFFLQKVHSPKSGKRSWKVSSHAVSRMVGLISCSISNKLSKICSHALVSASSEKSSDLIRLPRLLESSSITSAIISGIAIKNKRAKIISTKIGGTIRSGTGCFSLTRMCNISHSR